MKLHEHILPDYDVKLVGTESEVLRYRREIHDVRAEAAWLDERIDLVREFAKRGLRGDMDPSVALENIVQSLVGVSRSTSAKP